MTSPSRKRVARASAKARRCVRPMLECLEDRNLLTGASVPFTVNVPANAGSAGQYIDFTVYGTLEANYTPQYGPSAGTQLTVNTVVYLTDTNGNYDWAALPTSNSPPPPSSPPILNAVPYLTETVNRVTVGNINAVTGGTLSFTIPSDAYITGGSIVMGVGTQSQPFTLYDQESVSSTGTISTIIPRPTPDPAGSPTYAGSIYDYVEFAYDDKGVVNGQTVTELDTDASQEDQVGLTYTLTTTGVDGTDTPQSTTVGITQTVSNLLTLFNTYMENPPFVVLDQVTSNRILSPGDYLEYYASDPVIKADYDALEIHFNDELNAFFTAFSQANSFSLYYSADNGTFMGNTTTTTLGPWYYVTSANYDSNTGLVTLTVQAPSGLTFDPSEFADGDSVTIGGVGAGYNGTFTISNSTANSAARTITFSYTPLHASTPAASQATGPNSVAWDTSNTSGGVTYKVLQVSFTTTGSPQPVFSGLDVYDPVAAEVPGWLAVSGTPTESPGQMVFAQSGVFASGNLDTAVPAGDAGYMFDFENAISSAINRGIATTVTPDNWASSTASFYPSGGTYNNYAAFLHQTSISENGKAYAFPYDDQGTQSTNVEWSTSLSGTLPTATINLESWSSSPSPSPPPPPSPSQSPSSPDVHLGQLVTVFLLAQDEFTYLVDGVFLTLTNDSLFTQSADRLMSLLNTRLPVDNHALFSGQSGLQSAILSNPYFGGAWGNVAAQTALESAVYDFFLLTKHHGKPS